MWAKAMDLLAGRITWVRGKQNVTPQCFNECAEVSDVGAFDVNVTLFRGRKVHGQEVYLRGV